MSIIIKAARPQSQEVKELSDLLHNDLELIYGKGLIESLKKKTNRC